MSAGGGWVGGGGRAVELWNGLEEVGRWGGRKLLVLSMGEHTISMATGLIFLSVAVRAAVHMVTEWTGCADDQRWGGELERGGGRLDQRQWSVPPISALSLPLSLSLSLSPPPTLPSADPKSCFDWISHELMRQA